MRGGWVCDRVASGARGRCGTERVPPRPGAGCGRGRGAPAMARPSRPDIAPLARPRRGRVLRDVLLRFGHSLLSGSRIGARRRQDARGARAGAVLVLARVGAPVATAAADRPGGRARDPAAPRPSEPGRRRRAVLRPRWGDCRAAPAPVGREPVDERHREPAARRAGGRAHPRRAWGAERHPGTGTPDLLPTAIVTTKSAPVGDAKALKV